MEARMQRPARLAACALVAVALSTPEAAMGATSFGSSQTGTIVNAACAGPNCTSAMETVGGIDAGSPVGGVIVSWSIRSGNSAAAPMRLRVLTRSGANYTGGPASSAVTVPAGAVTTTGSTRLPIAPGQYLGVDHPDTAGAIASNSSSDLDRTFNGTLLDGETRAPTNSSVAEVQLRATVEPDADSDGYGDETQDACPSDAARHEGCSADLALAVAAPATADAGSPLTYTFTVTNRSASPATGVVVRVPLGGGLAVASATPSTGSCTGTSTVVCSLGALAGSASATVSVTTGPAPPGTIVTDGSLGSTTVDPDPSNDGASATTVVPDRPIVLDRTRPTLTRISLTPGRFRVAGSSTATIAATPRGTRLRFVLSEPAVLIAEIERSLPRIVRTVRSRRRVTPARRVYVGSLIRHFSGGPQSLAFSGRVRSAALAVGSYRMTLTAVDAAGNRSLARAISFSIVRR